MQTIWYINRLLVRSATPPEWTSCIRAFSCAWTRSGRELYVYPIDGRSRCQRAHKWNDNKKQKCFSSFILYFFLYFTHFVFRSVSIDSVEASAQCATKLFLCYYLNLHFELTACLRLDCGFVMLCARCRWLALDMRAPIRQFKIVWAFVSVWVNEWVWTSGRRTFRCVTL